VVRAVGRVELGQRGGEQLVDLLEHADVLGDRQPRKRREPGGRRPHSVVAGPVGPGGVRRRLIERGGAGRRRVWTGRSRLSDHLSSLPRLMSGTPA